MRIVIKLIDYVFQNRMQLLGHDDSNSMRHLSPDFRIHLIGRFNCHNIEHHVVSGDNYSYLVTFLPNHFGTEEVFEYIFKLNPDVIHLHGTHIWKQYPIYAKLFRERLNCKMIFSGAGPSTGTPEFLANFDKVIVNHKIQIERMKCEPEKVIVRKRSADPNIFYPVEKKKEYDFLLVAGFVPGKRIDIMIDYVLSTPYTMIVLGDFTRKTNHYNYIKNYILKLNAEKQIFLHDFISQTDMSEFMGKCRVWVWPQCKPENPSTTTNRSVIESLACGMPLLVGNQAFKDTEFVRNGMNGWLYGDINDFRWKADNAISDYKIMGKNSSIINRNNFDFKKNFIDFYNDLYQNL
jgi:glycosyltransferase involved in cell wall biosynthesis